MDLLERYWYLAVGILGGSAWIWLYFVWRRRPEGSGGVLGFLLFGPLLPAVDSYLKKRGGLTRREWIGWGIVVIVMAAAIAFTVITGSGVRGR
jgi:hypothetical protein